jgi:hypothetical protein
MTDLPRYYIEREDYVTAPDRPDFFVMDRQTGIVVDVSSIEANALRYCATFNRKERS